MADIRSREHHSPPNGRHRHYSTTSHSSKRHGHHKHLNGNNGTVSSEDSESDSSSSSSSNSSNSSHNSKSSKCRSKLKRSRSRSSSSSSSNSSKSTLSDAHHMSGVSDAEEAMHLLNGCDSNGASSASVFWLMHRTYPKLIFSSFNLFLVRVCVVYTLLRSTDSYWIHGTSLTTTMSHNNIQKRSNFIDSPGGGGFGERTLLLFVFLL